MSFEQVLFIIVSLILLASALGAVFARRIMHSALLAVAAFTGVGGIYAILGSHFLAVAQVLIYIGAVAIVLLFAVMLSQQREISGSNPVRKQKLWKNWVTWAAFGVGLVMVLYFTVNLATPTASQEIPLIHTEPATSLEGLSELLFREYLVPFELVSLLLLLVVIGAVVIARKENDPQ